MRFGLQGIGIVKALDDSIVFRFHLFFEVSANLRSDEALAQSYVTLLSQAATNGRLSGAGSARVGVLVGSKY